MITGIGIDIIDVERIKKIIIQRPRFLDRIFTSSEIRYCERKKNKYQNLASRFASKEAFFKALGKRIKWTDIEVTNLSTGKPQLKIKTKEQYPFTTIHVSISHLEDYAVAVVILEKD